MRGALLGIVAAVLLVLGLFYLVKSGVLSELLETDSVSTTVETSSATVSTANEVSRPNTGFDSSTILNGFKLFLQGMVTIAQRFVEIIVDMVSADSPSQTLINGAILTGVFVLLGYLAVLVAKVFRFIFIAAAIFTAGITVLYVLGLI